jgi:hypothetical protein
MHDAKLMYGPFEVNMPVTTLGYPDNRFFRWGMLLEKFQRNAHTGWRLATRQRIEGSQTLESYARDDRLQTRGRGRRMDRSNG